MYSEQRSGLAVPQLSTTVLVVEDEPLLRLAIVADLEEEGFTVFEASGAAEAIGILEKHSDIRLLFTDIDMPGTMDGLLLAAFVRDRWPPIKIIVTSGHRFPEIGQLPTDTPFMSKPYAANDVASAIRLLTGE
ncbi:response regulator [Rhizobium grahamii]|uniref:Two-component response regulator protein n=2 Tax=Rhizobium grahamii TaxID=1120045 RepID=S3HCP9_9HYPH|nr:response regulator [Rhizobium grahamii]EPE96439.1 two-component response regulator protein [Rhizobium grahamii CCGE 502]RDJ03235.1 response regulator [Rhizobium grahamii]